MEIDKRNINIIDKKETLKNTKINNVFSFSKYYLVHDKKSTFSTIFAKFICFLT